MLVISIFLPLLLISLVITNANLLLAHLMLDALSGMCDAVCFGRKNAVAKRNLLPPSSG